MLIQQWHLPLFPPSLNGMQRNNGHHRFDTAEYKIFKRDIETLIQAGNKTDLRGLEDAAFSLHVYFHWDKWWRKDGTLRRNLDCSNRYLAIENGVFRAIGIDDSRNVAPIAFKRRQEKSGDPYMVVKLYLITDENYPETLDIWSFKEKSA